jgi:predicted transcriptional regulator
MNAKHLSNLNEHVKQMISQHLQKNQLTLTEFARNAGIHQSHLWCFMNTDSRSLNSKTLEKIGKYIDQTLMDH